MHAEVWTREPPEQGGSWSYREGQVALLQARALVTQRGAGVGVRVEPHDAASRSHRTNLNSHHSQHQSSEVGEPHLVQHEANGDQELDAANHL